MKRFLSTACLFACLFVASGCDSAVINLSQQIRNIWERINGTAPKSASTNPNFPPLKEADAKPLTAIEEEHMKRADELIELARSPNPDPAALGREVFALRENLDREFPPLPPISRDSLMKTLNPSLPAQIGSYKFVSKTVTSYSSKQDDELLPGIWFRPGAAYKYAIAQYQSPDGKEMVIEVVDRGYLGAWARTGNWVYLSKGRLEQAETKSYNYAGLMNDARHQWVVWESIQGNYRVFLSQWSDRWQIIIVGGDLSGLAAINSKWLETVQ